MKTLNGAPVEVISETSSGLSLVYLKSDPTSQFSVRTNRLREVSLPSRRIEPSDSVKYATAKRVELAKEMFEYVREKQPLHEPTGANGKVAQVAWRTTHNLRYIDAISSTLSTWTSLLRYNGLIFQDENGDWRTHNANAVFPEKLKDDRIETAITA